MENETNSTYPNQDSGEITQRVVYKHIAAIALVLLGMAFLALFAIVCVIYLNINKQQIENVIPAIFVNIIGFILIALIVSLTVATIWIWRRNKVIITNRHIVDIDQIGLFNLDISTLRLEEIQDISARVNGVFQTALNYGTVIIQTAGERENFVLDYVPKPHELEDYIIDLRAKYYPKDNS
jgi:hypothetical protein